MLGIARLEFGYEILVILYFNIMASNSKIQWTEKVWNPMAGLVRFVEERLTGPLHWEKSKMIFVDSM